MKKIVDKPYVIKEDYQFPFSRGILTQSLVNSGLSTEESYEIATVIQDELVNRGLKNLTSDELKFIVADYLLKRLGEDAKNRYLRVSAIRIGVIRGTSISPYSKGIMSQTLKASGLEPSLSYEIARRIETYLFNQGTYNLTNDELRAITYNIVKKHCGQAYAERYLLWRRSVRNPSKPFILLFGGGTGAGKSTVSVEIAHRLGLTAVLSTDSIREIMRSMISSELMPCVHQSSFTAWEAFDNPIPDGVDPLVIAFREQVAKVSVGIMAIIERAIKENVSLVMDGIHIVPGFIKKEYFQKANIAFVIISINDRELHKERFLIRENQTLVRRQAKKYLDNFENIRKLQDYIISLAKTYEVPVIDNVDMDRTVEGVLEYITEFMKDIVRPDYSKLLSG